MNLNIVVYAQDEATFKRAQNRLKSIDFNENIIWCNAGHTERAQVINQNLNSWLLFIDHDCELSIENIKLVRELATQDLKYQNQAYAGLYADDCNSTYLQKAHNFIANNWLLQSYELEGANPLILGGVFLINANKEIKLHQSGLFWGAEDKALSYELWQTGFRLDLIKDFRVLHKTSNTWTHFFKRAYAHGKNDISYIKEDNNKISYLFWIRKIGFANLYFVPLIVGHFCIQRWAELVQKARR